MRNGLQGVTNDTQSGVFVGLISGVVFEDKRLSDIINNHGGKLPQKKLVWHWLLSDLQDSVIDAELLSDSLENLFAALDCAVMDAETLNASIENSGDKHHYYFEQQTTRKLIMDISDFHRRIISEAQELYTRASSMIII